MFSCKARRFFPRLRAPCSQNWIKVAKQHRIALDTFCTELLILCNRTRNLMLQRKAVLSQCWTSALGRRGTCAWSAAEQPMCGLTCSGQTCSLSNYLHINFKVRDVGALGFCYTLFQYVLIFTRLQESFFKLLLVICVEEKGGQRTHALTPQLLSCSCRLKWC